MHYYTIWKLSYRDDFNGMIHIKCVDSPTAIEGFEFIKSLYVGKTQFTLMQIEKIEVLKTKSEKEYYTNECFSCKTKTQ